MSVVMNGAWRKPARCIGRVAACSAACCMLHASCCMLHAACRYQTVRAVQAAVAASMASMSRAQPLDGVPEEGEGEGRAPRAAPRIRSHSCSLHAARQPPWQWPLRAVQCRARRAGLQPQRLWAQSA